MYVMIRKDDSKSISRVLWQKETGEGWVGILYVSKEVVRMMG